jgi:predicted Holliday junction resolvase-like endonuclease
LGSNVLARDYNAEIQAKQQEAGKLDAESERLRGVAATLAEAVSRLQNQINEIQGHIDESQKKHDDLVAEIAQNEILIQKNRNALGDILSEMYVDDQISPLEMLASSKSIGDFIDKQEQRSSLKSSLNDKIKEIKQQVYNYIDVYVIGNLEKHMIVLYRDFDLFEGNLLKNHPISITINLFKNIKETKQLVDDIIKTFIPL